MLLRSKSRRLRLLEQVGDLITIFLQHLAKCYLSCQFPQTDSWSIPNNFMHYLTHNTDRHGLVGHRFSDFWEHVRFLGCVQVRSFLYTTATLYGVGFPLISLFCMIWFLLSFYTWITPNLKSCSPVSPCASVVLEAQSIVIKLYPSLALHCSSY